MPNIFKNTLLSRSFQIVTISLFLIACFYEILFLQILFSSSLIIMILFYCYALGQYEAEPLEFKRQALSGKQFTNEELDKNMKELTTNIWTISLPLTALVFYSGNFFISILVALSSLLSYKFVEKVNEVKREENNRRRKYEFR